jgi:hypothetical protein
MTQIAAYASRTGTARNLSALRTAGWGLFVAALGVHRDEGFRFMVENSAYSFWTHGMAWHEGPVPKRGKGFAALLASHGRSPLCDGIIAPDIVCGGMESLRLSLSWLPRLLEYGPRVYIPVQPEIPPQEIAPLLGERVGVFVGGDSRWKEQTAAAWTRLAHEAGALCHVGRVNSRRRLMICKAAGVDSFDGSGPSRFEVVLHEMERFRGELCQLGLQLRLSAWVFFGDEWIELTILYGEGLDAILLAAQQAGAVDVHEVQVEDGAWERHGAGFVFMSNADGL